jgi:hypothetical protein
LQPQGFEALAGVAIKAPAKRTELSLVTAHPPAAAKPAAPAAAPKAATPASRPATPSPTPAQPAAGSPPVTTRKGVPAWLGIVIVLVVAAVAAYFILVSKN